VISNKYLPKENKNTQQKYKNKRLNILYLNNKKKNLPLPQSFTFLGLKTFKVFQGDPVPKEGRPDNSAQHLRPFLSGPHLLSSPVFPLSPFSDTHR
jgi:hypothetical protein